MKIGPKINTKFTLYALKYQGFFGIVIVYDSMESEMCCYEMVAG